MLFRSLAVAYLDFDDFKMVNDSHGHEAGDIVLCETARRVLAVVRGPTSSPGSGATSS